jgi:hypothetical protein
MTFDGISELMFEKTAKLSHYAVCCACVSFFGVVMLLGVHSAIEALWTGYAGIACTFAAITSALVAFSAQTLSQAIRVTSKIVAKYQRREAPVFRDEDYIYGKPAQKAFKGVKEKGANPLNSLKAHSYFNVHVRSTARAHRRAPRSAFTRPSGDSTGDSSGESDSGEPAKPLHRLTFQTLFSFNHKKWNSFSRTKHFSRRCDCWYMRRYRQPFGRWSV